MSKCAKCKKEDKNVKLRIVGRAESNDPRLICKDDVIVQDFLCDLCFDEYPKAK